MADSVEVVNINVMSKDGRSTAMLYGVRAVPTLIVVDGCGQEVATFAGVALPGSVIETVNAIPQCTNG